MLLFSAQMSEKEPGYPPTLKTGMEYNPLDKIAFRTGINLRPQAGFFGAGFNGRKFQLDYALRLDDATGMSHQAGVVCKFSRP